MPKGVYIRKPKYGEDNRRCSKCKLILPRDKFSTDNSRFMGFAYVCKKCHGQMAEERRKRSTKMRKMKAEYSKRSIQKYPEKHKARSKVRWAILKGILKKEPCEKCGSEKAEAHHPDYTKPLDVIWLCKMHHMEAHGRM